MDITTIKNGIRTLDGVDLCELAEQYGTPLYVYSERRLYDNVGRYLDAFAGMGGRIFYAVKANPNLSILRIFSRLGLGFDIVSGGELERLKAAGILDAEVIFSGVGKTEEEIRSALEYGVKCFNIESRFEIEAVDKVARRMGVKAPVALRVNPDVDPGTHPHVSTGHKGSKFGVPMDEAKAVFEEMRSRPNLEIIGLDCHIGSQITRMEPFVEVAKKMFELVDELDAMGVKISHLDLGGGVGISYRKEEIFDLEAYAGKLKEIRGDRDVRLFFEPGRSLVGDAGITLTKVLGVKEQSGKNYVVVDAAMNDLMRPVLYEAHHEVGNVCTSDGGERPKIVADVVGPVCESGDFLALDRTIGAAEGDLLWIADTGAYGMSMASNYNSRNRPAEVLISSGNSLLVRAREQYEDQWMRELEAFQTGFGRDQQS